MARGKKACRCGKQGNIGLFGGQTQSIRGGKADHFSVETTGVTGISLRIIITLAGQSVTLGPIHCCRRRLQVRLPARYVSSPQAFMRCLYQVSVPFCRQG